MFGVGPQEMGVIALLALIIFGPGKLPEVMREAGKHYRKFKGMADEMTGELNKVTAEARKELDGALGDLGPMGKDLEKSLGVKGGSKTRTTSTGSKSTSSVKKVGSSSTSSSSGSKRTTTSKSSSSSGSRTTAAGSSTIGQPKTPAKPLIASKEDPLADFSVFEGERKEKRTRKRTAAPSAITDLTPRDIFGDTEPEVAEKTPLKVDLAASNDPVDRARARRRQAGYARA